MKWIQKLLPLTLVLLMLVPVSMDLSRAEDTLEGVSEPTRTYFQETEGNNQWSSADTIPVTTGQTIDLHGNLSSGTDYDYFYLNLDGGIGNVDQVTITPKWLNGSDFDPILAWVWGFVSEEISNPNNDETSIAVDDWFPASYTGSLVFSASYTGKYGLIIRPNEGLSSAMKYNFSITISAISPVDNHNDKESSRAISPGSSLITESLVTNNDLFDWYKVTSPHAIYPTIIDMTFTISTFSPDYTYSPYEYGVELDIFVLYNSRSSQSVFTKTEYRVASATKQNFIDNGCKASPFDIDIEQNCTELYIGVMIRSFGLSSTGARTYILTPGSASYNIDIDVSANIPNKRPYIWNAGVEPVKGTSQDVFTFSVLYFDPQNESAEHVELWLDGSFFKDMRIDSQGANDFTKGVRYYVDVPGNQIGKDSYHYFNISASDGRDWALGRQNGTRTINGPIVDDNLPPQSDVGDSMVIDLVEDSDPVWLVMDDLFSDPNTEETGFKYLILDENGEWDNNQFSDGNILAQIVNNGTDILPDLRLKISPQPNVNGEYRLYINASDGEFFEKFTVLEIILVITGSNDPPVIKMVDSSVIQEWDISFSYDLEQGEMFDIDLRAEDMDGDDLNFYWDIGEVLSSPMEGENYGFNTSSGSLWFIPGDGDVPGFETKVTVDDGNGAEDEFKLDIYVDNVNDPPRIDIPDHRSTIQGESLFIIPSYSDPDMDSGDIVTFSYDLGALGSRTPSSAVDFTQSTGRLELRAISEEMIGDWEVNITIVDLDGLADWDICSITIGNVNDPPEIYDINLEQQNNNLTVVFHTSEATDQDQGDVLTYIWDFGDGSDIMSGTDLKDVSHTFPSEGAFTVTLKIYDGLAYSETKELIITVTAPLPDPDQDKDGIEDIWELRFGFDPTDPADALLDPDDDGMTNLEEYQYYESTGEYLNPWDPDTDRDGWKDGEEYERNFDPLEPSIHPEDPNEGINLILFVAGILLLFLGLMLALLFLVLRRRNKKASVAMPVAAAPIPASMEQLPEAGYDQMEQGTYEQLPPADPMMDQQDQGQYAPDGMVYGGAAYPGQQDGSADLEMPQEDLYGGMYQDQYQDPNGSGQQIYQDPVYDEGQTMPEVPEQDLGVPLPEETMIPEETVPSPSPEPISEVPPPQMDLEQTGQVEGENVEDKKEADGLPPVPKLPDL